MDCFLADYQIRVPCTEMSREETSQIYRTDDFSLDHRESLTYGIDDRVHLTAVTIDG